MKCFEVQELLSVYFDEELADDVKSRVAAHVDQCAECALDLAGFEKLSFLAGTLDDPSPPAQMWGELEKQLDAPVDAPPSLKKPSQANAIPRMFAIAASLAVALGVSWFAYHSWFGHGDHSQFTVEFGHYLEEFRRDPIAAQQVLLAKYEHELVDPQLPIKSLGYRPAVAAGLPADYSLVSTHVMNMPCCKCVQSVCRRSDGSTLAIFEHDDEEGAEWFGDMPGILAKCNEKECVLVELDDQIAASWKRGKRHITLIGVRDIGEVSQIVKQLDGGVQPVAN